MSPAQRLRQLARQERRVDITRGMPGPEQLTLSDGLLSEHNQTSGLWRDQAGLDVRNYAVQPEGLEKIRSIFAPLLDVPIDQLCANGSSSLRLMFDVAAAGFWSPLPGTGIGSAWRRNEVVFLCPTPGYDRHFAICEELGIELRSVPMTADGPDTAEVERCVRDPRVKGMWCVPRFDNPTGVVYSDRVVRELASMETAAQDFRLYWDDAYAVHGLSAAPPVLFNVLAECQRAGHPDRTFVFSSTSKITYPGSGVAFFGSSPANVAWWRERQIARSISPNRVNQLLHAEFFESAEGVRRHMDRHRDVIAPRFESVHRTLTSELGDLISCDLPAGGYFLWLGLPAGTAQRTVDIAAQAGVRLTPVDLPYPPGSPHPDDHIRIAPTFPSASELEFAVEVVCRSVEVAVTLSSGDPVPVIVS